MLARTQRSRCYCFFSSRRRHTRCGRDWSSDVCSSDLTAPDRRFANGMLAFYVDPKVIDTSTMFDGEVTRYVDFIRATKPIGGVDQVLIPGDPERKTRAERTKNGIPLPDDTWAAIVNTAREVGVSEVSIQRATA